VIAVVMALGTGLLIGSVSFELIDEALKTRVRRFPPKTKRPA
jgi:zinc transporter, ZIP family